MISNFSEAGLNSRLKETARQNAKFSGQPEEIDKCSGRDTRQKYNLTFSSVNAWQLLAGSSVSAKLTESSTLETAEREICLVNFRTRHPGCRPSYVTLGSCGRSGVREPEEADWQSQKLPPNQNVLSQRAPAVVLENAAAKISPPAAASKTSNQVGFARTWDNARPLLPRCRCNARRWP